MNFEKLVGDVTNAFKNQQNVIVDYHSGKISYKIMYMAGDEERYCSKI